MIYPSKFHGVNRSLGLANSVLFPQILDRIGYAKGESLG